MIGRICFSARKDVMKKRFRRNSRIWIDENKHVEQNNISLQKMWVKVQPWLMVKRKYVRIYIQVADASFHWLVGLKKSLKRPKKSKLFRLVRHVSPRVQSSKKEQVLTSGNCQLFKWSDISWLHKTFEKTLNIWNSTFVCLQPYLFLKTPKPKKTLSF